MPHDPAACGFDAAVYDLYGCPSDEGKLFYQTILIVVVVVVVISFLLT